MEADFFYQDQVIQNKDCPTRDELVFLASANKTAVKPYHCESINQSVR
jgi:hypothetical protein